MQIILDKCPSDRVCDFETDSCGYVNDANADINWIRQSGDSSISSESLLFDHTYQTGEGFYMLSQFSTAVPGLKARFISPNYENAEGISCLNWWYNMHSNNGIDLGRFNVYIIQNGVISSEPIWSISYSQGNIWRSASVTIQFTSNKIQVKKLKTF